MTLTAGQVLKFMKHRTAGPLDSDLGGGMYVLNLAGRHCFSMHPWRSALNVSADLATVSGQSWVALPTWFAEPIACEVADNSDFIPVDIVGPREMLLLRNGNLGNLGFVKYVSVEGESRLGLFPTPDSDAPAVLRLTYRARWQDVSKDTDPIVCASFLEGLVLEVAREYAAGLEGGDLSARIAMVEGGPICRAAKNADGSLQPMLGPMMGGAVRRVRNDPWDWVRNVTGALGPN